MITIRKPNVLDIKKIKEISHFISQNLENIKIIILFGSFATKGQGNDIDIVLVTAPWEKDIKELESYIGKKIRPICQKYPIDYFVLPLNLIEKHTNSAFLKLINTTGRLLYMDKEIINKWIVDAKIDYEQSCYLFKGEYYKGACYFAQQSIEKFVKSKLLLFGWELQKVHSIVFLVSELGYYKYTIQGVDDEELTFIDSIYKGRYPGEEGLLPYGNPSRDEALKAINITYRIGAEMGQKLEKLTIIKEE
ncbi:MAG: HEPN domain-containing protein [Candidatus Scalindua sp.]